MAVMKKNLLLQESVRVRRTLFLAMQCLGNIAGYRAGWIECDGKDRLRVNRDFWIRLNGNFLDMATLDWCKLFADKSNAYHWSKIFKSKSIWKTELSRHTDVPMNEMKGHVRRILTYRNKYVAHLDPPDEIVYYPRTDFMLKSASFLYDQIRCSDETGEFVRDFTSAAGDWYQLRFSKAFDEYDFVAKSLDSFRDSREVFK
jgi:hypothetical protein